MYISVGSISFKERCPAQLFWLWNCHKSLVNKIYLFWYAACIFASMLTVCLQYVALTETAQLWQGPTQALELFDILE